MVDKSYPKEVQLNKINAPDIEAPFPGADSDAVHGVQSKPPTTPIPHPHPLQTV